MPLEVEKAVFFFLLAISARLLLVRFGIKVKH